MAVVAARPAPGAGGRRRSKGGRCRPDAGRTQAAGTAAARVASGPRPRRKKPHLRRPGEGASRARQRPPCSLQLGSTLAQSRCATRRTEEAGAGRGGLILGRGGQGRHGHVLCVGANCGSGRRRRRRVNPPRVQGCSTSAHHGARHPVQVSSAYTTVNDINARLSEIKGIKVVSIVPRRSDLVANLRRYWGWLCVVSAWAALCAASVLMQEDPLENLNNLQEVLLHSAIAMAIAAWAYHIGRKSTQRLSIYASAAELAAQEAGERARRAANN